MQLNKKGFTFVELMAVIVVIGIVLVLTVPRLFVDMNSAKSEAEVVFVKSIDKAINQYVSTNKDKFSFSAEYYQKAGTTIPVKKVTKKGKTGNAANFTFEDLISAGILKNEFKNPNNDNVCDVTSNLNIYRDDNFVYYYSYDLGCLYKYHDYEAINKTEEDETEKSEEEEEETGGGASTLPGDEDKPEYKDNSGANQPDLVDGLTPIKYDSLVSSWKVADPYNEAWYDYDKLEWANAAILKTDKKAGDKVNIETEVYATFVWIPRYKYAIGCNGTASSVCYGREIVGNNASSLSRSTPGAIDIQFVTISDTSSGDANYNYGDGESADSAWLTHPAFTFGDKQVNGIWVAKFETSVDNSSSCYIHISNKYYNDNETYESTKTTCNSFDTKPLSIPNALVLTGTKLGNLFDINKEFSSEYDVDINSHLIKHSELAATLYLSQSKYGKYNNSSFSGENKEIYFNNSGRNNSYYSDPWGGYTGRSYGAPAPTSTGSIIYSEEGSYKYDGTESVDMNGASTTGNIYGVYDMSGGVHESVMGYYVNATTKTDNSGLSTSLSEKDIDKTTSASELGKALKEVNLWYGDTYGSLNYYYFLYGGYFGGKTGAFAATSNNGNPGQIYGSRAVLVKE